MNEIFLIRHAKAGERRLWKGDDMLRPLSKKGWRQSQYAAKKLARKKPTVLLSSPYVRCIQTLEPLGDKLGKKVQIDHRLCEYEPVGPLLELLSEAPRGAVLSSHGDLIPAAIRAIKKSGAHIRGNLDWRKSTIWRIERNKHGKIIRATCWPAPKF